MIMKIQLQDLVNAFSALTKDLYFIIWILIFAMIQVKDTVFSLFYYASTTCSEIWGKSITLWANCWLVLFSFSALGQLSVD